MQTIIIQGDRLWIKTLAGNLFSIFFLVEIPIALLAHYKISVKCSIVVLWDFPALSGTLDAKLSDKKVMINLYNTITYLPFPFLSKGDEFLSHSINQGADTLFSAQQMQFAEFLVVLLLLTIPFFRSCSCESGKEHYSPGDC